MSPSLRVSLLALFCAGATLGGSGGSAAMAAGLECFQDCSSGSCVQALCAASTQNQGFCACRSGALPWSDSLYASWCSASGRPQPNCMTPTPAWLAHADVLASALQSRNPFAATLVSAMLDDQRWAEGPVEGMVHESRFDAQAGLGLHSQAVRFVGQALAGGVDATHLSITVLGDLGTMGALSRALGNGAAQLPVTPQSIQGSVIEGGLHGSLVIFGPSGQSETVQW